MVDSVLHAEPYTKQELCQFFGLTVCLKDLSLRFLILRYHAHSIQSKFLSG